MRRPAVVLNPTKLKDLSRLKTRLTAVFREYGWDEPSWWLTTTDETGTRQAQDAVAEGAELVAALGGDGTVRSVAAGLLPSGTPMAVLATGTGNLFARQLGLPVGDFARGLRAALTAPERRVDVMRVRWRHDGASGGDEIGLVMGGVGVDAEIMDGTSERLKQRIGWLAYPAAALPHLIHERVPVTVRFEPSPTSTPDVVDRDVTSVLVGNCGLLQGGIQLMPDAKIDDGLLDAVLVRGSGLHWLPVVTKVLARSRRDSVSVTRRACREVQVDLGATRRLEIDGDTIGSADTVTFSVEPGALLVRANP